MGWNRQLFYMLQHKLQVTQHKLHVMTQAHFGDAKENRQNFLYVSASVLSNEMSITKIKYVQCLYCIHKIISLT